jgi:hypothetical protein
LIVTRARPRHSQQRLLPAPSRWSWRPLANHCWWFQVSSAPAATSRASALS